MLRGNTQGPASVTLGYGLPARLAGVLLVALCLALIMAWPAAAQDSEGCLICHGDPNFTDPTPDEGEEEGVEDASLYVNPESFMNSVHAGLKCSDCHKGFMLTIPQHQQDMSKDFRQVAIEACEGCHAEAYQEYLTSSHSQSFYQEHAGPICISCHGSHEIRRVRIGEESADFKMSMARDSCGQCHEDKFEQASEEFHFKALSLGYERAATCFDCHGWHENLPLHSGDPETVEACQQCHPGANAGFTYFQMHLEHGFGNAWWGVRAVYYFFSTLLVVVLVTGIAYTTVHLQKESRIMLGVFGRGMGRLFGFIRHLEEESVKEREQARRDRADSEGGPDEDDEHGGAA